MNLQQIIEKLSRQPRIQRIVLYAGAYLILVVAFWGLLYLPASNSLTDYQSKKRVLSMKIAEIDARIGNKDQYEQDLAELMAALKQAKKELPNAREIDELLKKLSTTGRKIGLEVTKFTPEAEEKLDYVAAVPVAIEVRGTFQEVAMFFDRVSKQNRIIYIKDITMGDAEEVGGRVKLKVSGTAVTFRFLAEDEIIENKKGKKKRRGRRGRRKAGGDR